MPTWEMVFERDARIKVLEDEMDIVFRATRGRIDDLGAALCDLYNECMAHGWNTSPMTEAMKAARAALQTSEAKKIPDPPL